LLATAARLRRKAAAIRNLLADPGDGAEEFKASGPAQAEFLENLSAELESLAN
jgi:hypothetical protein